MNLFELKNVKSMSNSMRGHDKKKCKYCYKYFLNEVHLHNHVRKYCKYKKIHERIQYLKRELKKIKRKRRIQKSRRQ